MRGVASALETSMMIMRTAADGQVGFRISTSAAQARPGVETASNSPRRAMFVGAGAAGQEAVVPDAVETVRRTWIRKRRMNSPVASVMTFWRSRPRPR